MTRQGREIESKGVSVFTVYVPHTVRDILHHRVVFGVR